MSKEIKKSVKDCILHNLYFKLFSFFAIALIIASFLVPPMGLIEPSVLAAVGELFGFASLGTVIKAIDKGTTATVTHNNTSVTVGREDDEEFDRPPHRPETEDWDKGMEEYNVD